MKIRNVKKIRRYLVNWYLKNRRDLPWRTTDNTYHIWISEVMLQQTQVNTAVPYYHKFLDQFPDIEHLAKADLQQVLKVWEGLGYYARARNLHKAAKMVLGEHGGKIPTNREDFRRLPGVGDYIASAVLSIALDQPYCAVDGNVKRVLARLFQIDSPLNKSGTYKQFKEIADELIDPAHPGIFNQAIMELGAMACKPRGPECQQCPITSFCGAYKNDSVKTYPKHLKSGPIPEYHMATGVVWKKNNFLIVRRKNEGLLGGLWEFPSGEIKDGDDPRNACEVLIREGVNLQIEIDSLLCRVKHAYTHFKIKMDVFNCRYVSGRVRLNGPVAHRWITLNKIDEYPFPKANHKFIPLLYTTT
ncbi:A/G-specific adenine glycosylase [Thermodesulfobacteriota bacterium]